MEQRSCLELMARVDGAKYRAVLVGSMLEAAKDLINPFLELRLKPRQPKIQPEVQLDEGIPVLESGLD